MIEVLTRAYRFSIPTWATVLCIATVVIAVAVILPGCASATRPDTNEAFNRGVEITKRAEPLDIFEEALPRGNRYWIFTEEDRLVELGTITPASADASDDPVYYAISRKIPAGSPKWLHIAEKFNIIPPGLEPTGDNT